MKALSGKLGGKPGGKPQRKRKPSDDLEYRRQRDLKALELKQAFPHWNRKQLTEEAERLISGLRPSRA